MLALRGALARIQRKLWVRAQHFFARLALLANGRAKQAATTEMSSGPLAEARMKVCNSCEWLRGSPPIERCGACGCFMRFKTQLPGATCPKGKW